MRIATFIVGIGLLISGLVYGQDAVPMDTVKSAPGITIETEIDKAEIYIGDLINYRLTVIHDSDITLIPPPIGANLGAFDVKDYQADDETTLKDGRKKIESRFLLTTFTTGDYLIPPIPIEYITPDSTRKVLISEPIAIRVSSLLAEDSDTLDIRDIKGPFNFKTAKTWLYFLIGGIILAAAIALYLIRYFRRKRAAVGEPVDTRKPWEIAFEDLAVLKEKEYPGTGEFKLYYVELTEIVRAFLGRIYSIPMLDMTTYEVCVAFRSLEIDEQLFERIKSFLMHADLVKFAKWVPEVSRMNEDFDEAHSIVEQLMQSELSKMASMQTEIASKVAGGAGV